MKIKSIHCFQHVAFEGPGKIFDWIQTNNHRLSVTRFYENDPLPNSEDIDGLLVMGGPMGIYDEDLYPWLKAEKAFIYEFLKTGKPILGICLGSQLLASVLGSEVYKNPEKEIGWFPIRIFKSDSNFRFFGNTSELSTAVFHWHGDTFNLPAGAEKLCCSEACSNQAYIFASNVLGLQFHVEATEESLLKMLNEGSHELIPGNFIQSRQEILENTVNLPENHRILFRILDTLF